jgi:integrase
VNILCQRLSKENKETGRELSDDEMRRLLVAVKASSSRAIYPAVVTSIHTGLRNQELRLLRWRQIDLLAATIQVGKSKTEGVRVRLSRPRKRLSSCSRNGVLSSLSPNRNATYSRVSLTA